MTEPAAGVPSGAWQAARGRLRQSMTAQIWLAVALVATLLVSGSSLLVLWLNQRELQAIGGTMMLSALVSVQQKLDPPPHDLARVADDALGAVSQPINRLHLALYDSQSRRVAATPGFEAPLQALPEQVVDVARLPQPLTQDSARAQLDAMAGMTRHWTSATGVAQELMAGQVLWPQAGRPAVPMKAVVALETGLLSQLWVYGLWVIGAAVLLSAALAALLGVVLANRIVVAARGFGAAAARIGAEDLGERLDLGRLPLELHDAGVAVNRMLDRLQAAFQRLREFSVDLAHDLRTPINNLLGEAQVALSRRRDEAEYRAVLESAIEDYERMARLIENLLFLARADDRPMPLQREWVDLRVLCERMRDYFEPLAEEAGLVVVVEGPAGPPGMREAVDAVEAMDIDGTSGLPSAPLWADRSLLVRALGNLVSNALRHAVIGSTVTLAYAAGPAGARLSVANVGDPIPAQYHQRIFERLFRIDPARHGSNSGSGLGLAIVKSVMLRHGGRVDLSSSAGQPTVFTLHFPPSTGLAPPP